MFKGQNTIDGITSVQSICSYLMKAVGVVIFEELVITYEVQCISFRTMYKLREKAYPQLDSQICEHYILSLLTFML